MSFIEFVVCSIVFVEFVIFLGYLVRAVGDRLFLTYNRVDKIFQEITDFVESLHCFLQEVAEIIADFAFRGK